MADRAQVTSVETIEAFRSSLIVYLSKARPAVEEIGNEVQRAQNWLDIEQTQFWEREIKIRTRKLEEAQQELLSARISKLQEATSEQQFKVQRARRLLQEAQEKFAVTKRWSRELENRADPLVKQVGQLHSFLTSDVPKAVAYLTQVIKTLEAYAEAAPGSLPRMPEPPGATGSNSDINEIPGLDSSAGGRENSGGENP